MENLPMEYKTPPRIGGADRRHEPKHERPEFIRLPRSGHRCPWTGLSRATLNSLILGERPPVKSCVLRSRGNIRGIRLISFESLLAYLNNLGQDDQGDENQFEQIR